jgi:hypothetical protein
MSITRLKPLVAVPLDAKHLTQGLLALVVAGLMPRSATFMLCPDPLFPMQLAQVE